MGQFDPYPEEQEAAQEDRRERFRTIAGASLASRYARFGGSGTRFLKHNNGADYEYVPPGTGIIDVTREALAQALAQPDLLRGIGAFSGWLLQGGFNMIRGTSRPLGITVRGSWLVLAGGLLGLISAKAAVIIGVVTVGFLVGSLLRWVAQLAINVWNFNWNITDVELDNQNLQAITSLYALTGTVFGGLLGRVICGGVPTLIVATFNAKLAAEIAKEMGDEMLQEIMGYVWAYAHGVARLAKDFIFRESYRNIRHFIKTSARSSAMRAILPDRIENIIEQWGSPKSKPWSFALETEQRIERIPDQNIRALAENFYEEFFDSCGEAFIQFADATQAALTPP